MPRRHPHIHPHHVSYDPEIIKPVYQGEHHILTHMARQTKNVSLAYIEEVDKWLAENRHKAVDLRTHRP